MKTSLLSVEKLVVFYENAIAVNNLSLKAEEGGITGVFGMNSAGKSTLMYTISGIMREVKRQEEMRGGERITILGAIRFHDQDISKLEPWTRARMGLVLCPERRRLFVESSVLENLKIGAYLANRSQWKDTLEYVFDLFPPLVGLRKKAAGFLSGGEQQMVAVGRALMCQPTLLLLDEPFLGLSIGMQDVLIEAIQKIGEERGITIVVSEQYARPLFPVIDYGYIIENGNVVIEGSSKDLLENPDVKSAYLGM